MNILGLDTCFDACSAALLLSGGGEVVSRFEPMAMGHAERLIPMVGEVVAEAGLAFAEIDRIAVTYGPGTFTGTRIAVAAARSLAFALHKPLVGVTSLAVMAADVAEEIGALEAGDYDIFIATDARRDEVYFQHFRGGRALTEPAVLSPQAAANHALDGRPVIVAGSGGAAVMAAAEKLPRRTVRLVRPDLLPSARVLVALARGLSVTDTALSPLYLRPADAKPQPDKTISRVDS